MLDKKLKIYILTIILAILLALELGGLLKWIDEAIYNSTPFFNNFGNMAISYTASFIAFLIYIILAVILEHLAKKKLSRDTVTFIISFIMGEIIVIILKGLTGVPRPDMSMISPPLNTLYFATLSFPSAHTLRAGIFSIYLYRKFPKYWTTWILYPLIIGISRLTLHLHWFSDVLFSLFLSLWLWLVIENFLKPVPSSESQ